MVVHSTVTVSNDMIIMITTFIILPDRIIYNFTECYCVDNYVLYL